MQIKTPNDTQLPDSAKPAVSDERLEFLSGRILTGDVDSIGHAALPECLALYERLQDVARNLSILDPHKSIDADAERGDVIQKILDLTDAILIGFKSGHTAPQNAKNGYHITDKDVLAQAMGGEGEDGNYTIAAQFHGNGHGNGHNLLFDPARTYVPPTAMIYRMHRGATPAMEEKLHHLLLMMLTTRSKEILTLDDGTKRTAEQTFIPAQSNPRGGGKETIYIDIAAQGFLQQTLGIENKTPPEDWLPLSRFDRFIGRTGHEADRIETFHFLYALWQENPDIEIAGQKKRARELVDFFPPYHGRQTEFMSQDDLPPELKDMALYASPMLAPYARQHLLHTPGDEQQGWLRIRGNTDGVVQRLHLSGSKDQKMKYATMLAVIMVLEELQKQPSLDPNEQAEPKPPEAFLGRFKTAGKHNPLEKDGAWLVSSELVGDGKPVNRERVLELRTQIMENTDDYPRLVAALNTPRTRGEN